MRFLLILVLSVMTLQANAACVVTDDSGQKVALLAPARRMVVLAPDLVENMFAIGAGQYVVGVVSGSDYPAAARKIPVVGSHSGIDLERIAALKPDLIVAVNYAFTRQLTALKRLGIPIFIASPKNLIDVPNLQLKFGCLTGQEQTARAVAGQFAKEVAELHAQFAAAKPVTVFFQIDHSALMTVNRDSWINQVIELCGGRNVFASARAITPLVNREAVLQANPEVILNDAANDGWKRLWQFWPDMAAVQKQRLYTVNPDWIGRAGPRLALGARQVCSYLAVVRASSPA